MQSLSQDFSARQRLVANANWQEAAQRLGAFYLWASTTAGTSETIDALMKSVNVQELLPAQKTGGMGAKPPRASSLEEIAAVGIYAMRQASSGREAHDIASDLGIRSPYGSNNLQDSVSELFSRYVDPALDYIGSRIPMNEPEEEPDELLTGGKSRLSYPVELSESIRGFLKDHPNRERNAFIMMQFGTTQAHQDIVLAIRTALGKYGIEGLRADDKEYHDDLFPNVQTYLHGCSFGIAVFERLESEEFNPNVALEVGFMRAQRKHVCLLRDKTLKTLPTDLIGKLYRRFDPQNPLGTIPGELEKWLGDKELTSL